MGKFNMKSRKASLFLAPRNVTLPTLTGEMRVGQTLTFGNATWSNSPTSYSRHIRREDGTLLATDASTYVPVTADIGHRLIPDETATNTYGSAIAYGATTEIVAAGQTTTLPATQTITFRDETLSGHGGHDLAYTGTGTLSISSGNGAGHWTITANKLVPSGTLNAQRTSLTGPYTLVITDGTDSTTATVNILQYGATVATVGELRLALQSSQRRWGDVIDMRAGVYNPAETRVTAKRATAPTQRGGGPVEPSQPYHSWITDSTTKAGWITVQPITADTVELRQFELAIESYQNWGVRFTGLTLRRLKPAGSYTVGGSIYVNSFNGIKKYGGVQFDNLDCEGNGRPDCKSSTNQNSSLFFFDNYFNGGQILCPASDSWIIGNEMQYVGSTADCIRHALYKTPSTGRDCFIAWNFLHDKLGTTTNSHTDGTQGDWSATTGQAPSIPVGDTTGYYSIGNIIIRGAGGGVGTFDFQGIFDGDMTATMRLTNVYVGNVIASDFANGITQSNALNSIWANNTLIWDQSNGGVSGSGYPRVRVDNEGQTSTGLTVKNNVAWGAPNYVDGTPPSSTETNNVWTVTTATAGTYFAAPVYGSSLATIASVLTAFAPLSPLQPGGQEKIGAIGTGYINHTNRTITVPGVTLPAYVPAYSA